MARSVANRIGWPTIKQGMLLAAGAAVFTALFGGLVARYLGPAGASIAGLFNRSA